MFKFLQKINIENFKKILSEMLKRLPLSALISLATFILITIIIRLEDIPYALEDNLHKVAFTLSLSFFFSIAIYLYTESKDINKNKKWLFQIITIVFALLFFYFFEENLFHNFQEETFVYLVLTSLGIATFIFIAPFISKLRTKTLSQEEFYIMSYALIIKIIMSAITGLAAMLLGFIALSSTFTLFNIEFIDESNWFMYWMNFSLVLFAPIFFLINLPSVKTGEAKNLQEIQSNKFYSFLINFISLPAIVIYFLILYAYAIKVLIHFSDWPHGEVAWMVILFSFFGYLIYSASFAFRNTLKSVLVFRKLLPGAIFIQTFMLFYAIGLRIRQYDLTINRYLVLAFGLWLFGLSLYFIISKKKSLNTIFYSLLTVIIFISLGPWSVYIVPEWRQKNNLEINLKKAHILQNDGSIKALKNYGDIEKTLSGEIYGGIDYLCEYHGYNTLNKYFKSEIDEIKKEDRKNFAERKKKDLEQAESRKNQDPEQIEKIKKKYYEISNRTLIMELTEKIKVRRYYPQEEIVHRNIEFRNRDAYLAKSINIANYDYFVQIQPNDFDQNADEEKIKNSYLINVNPIAKKLELFLGNNLSETFQIEKTIIQALLQKRDSSLEPLDKYDESISLNEEDMTFDLNGLNYNLHLVFKNISIENPDWVNNEENETDQRTSPLYIDGYALIKKK